MKILKTAFLVASMLILSSAASADDDVRVRLDGRALNAGDSYSVEVSVDFVVLDWNKGEKRGDGARVFSESMVDYRRSGTRKAKWSLTVPASGAVRGADARISFGTPLRVVPGRSTQYLVGVRFSRMGTGPNGEAIDFTTNQTFPVAIQSDAETSELCVIFQGMPGALLTVGVKKSCTESVLPRRDRTARPSKK